MVGRMLIRDIYEKYQVPPWLQLHQLRVAAVGKMVAQGCAPDTDIDLIVSTCLLHDIGAIVKFDFGSILQEKVRGLCPSADVPHWIAVQETIRARYGHKEHEASGNIIKELGFEKIEALFNDTGFSEMRRILAAGNLEAMVAQYADMRVGPYGILPLKDRVNEVIERYADVPSWKARVDESRTYLPLACEMETRLFDGIQLRPEGIDDVTAAPAVAALWEYELT